MRTVLFDLDGTLMLTGGAGVRGMNRAGREIFGDHFSIDGVPIAGGLDPVIYRQAAERCGITEHAAMHDKFRERYVRTLAEELAGAPDDAICLPGVRSLLADLAQESDILVGMVTGNYRAAAPVKLVAGGLKPQQFRVAAFGDDAATRPDVVAVAMERTSRLRGKTAVARDFVVVGDTPRDVECAHAHGIACLAVATGMYSTSDLRAAGADVVTATLADPAPLWAMSRG
jgi:phosphoglycolate phosphatase-like HAD superfamily hydrolase